MHIGFSDKLISSRVKHSFHLCCLIQRLFLQLVSWDSVNRVIPCFLPCLTNAAPSSVCHMSENERDSASGTSPPPPWRWNLHLYTGGGLSPHTIPSPNPTPRDEERLWHSMWMPITSPNRRSTQSVGSACFSNPFVLRGRNTNKPQCLFPAYMNQDPFFNSRPCQISIPYSQ